MSKTGISKILRKTLLKPTRRYSTRQRAIFSLRGLTLSIVMAAIIICAIPDAAFTRLPPIDSRDPYLRTMLLAKLTYGYETSTNSTEDTTETTNSKFFQTYDISLTGNWWDPRFIIFDTNITYTNTVNTYSSGSSDLIGHNWNYKFMTVLLRKFRFPLTLLATRTTSESSSIGSVRTIRDTYQADWYMKFKLLPVTRLKVRRIVSDSGSSHNVSDSLGLEMTKDIGRTHNKFNYHSSKSSDSVQSLMTFSNSTKLSSDTRFSASSVYGSSSSSSIDGGGSGTSIANPNSAEDSTNFGLSMNISSTPSRVFSQEHRYSYYSTKSGEDTNSTGQIFSGDIFYQPNDTYSASLGMSLDEVKNDTDTSQLEDESLSIDGSFKYNISTSFRFNQSFRYARSESVETDTATRESFNETMSATSGLSFSKQMSWASFGSSYGVGYTKTVTRPPDTESTGLAQDISLSLTNLGKRVVTLNNAFTASRTDNLTGEVWTSAESYSSSLTNVLGKKFFNLNAQGAFIVSRDYKTIRDNESKSYSLGISSDYIFKTSISGGYAFSDATDGINGNNTNELYTLSAGRGQKVFKGLLTLNANYTSQLNTSSKGETEERMSYDILARYTRPLLWKVNWISSATFRHLETTTSAVTTTRESLGLTNSLTYGLRAWTLSLRHRYRQVETTTNLSFNESEIIFKASRVIRRVF